MTKDEWIDAAALTIVRLGFIGLCAYFIGLGVLAYRLLKAWLP